MAGAANVQKELDFIAGTVEGFYGKPWSEAERFQLFDWMSEWGLNTYLYAPKDDLKHRALWRELYSAPELQELRELIGACQKKGLRFIYALSPGLDIRYSDPRELELLRGRLEQLASAGCQDFALLFDDIPGNLDEADLRKWGSLPAAQAQVTNSIFDWSKERFPRGLVLFCPTPYCGRMAKAGHGGEGYLEKIGQQLGPGIDVMWTGPEIISEEITVEHVQEVGAMLRRKPLIWDNLHANDYDGHRFFCGPYSGRPPELREYVAGILSNPNCEFPLNFVPLRTLAEYVQSGSSWKPRQAYLNGMREWLPEFESVEGQGDLEDLVLLGDCYYLPQQSGPEAEALYQQAKAAAQDAAKAEADLFLQRARRLRDFCARLPNLVNRPLFHALSRRVWELREELELLSGYVERSRSRPKGARGFASDFHLPGTYRGGLVARLQRLLVQHPDGTFTPATPDREN